MSGFAWNWPVVFFFVLFAACIWLMAAAVHKAKWRPHPLALALWSVWGLWVTLSPVWYRLTTQLDGMIVSSEDVPSNRGPRYATKYLLRAPDGFTVEYWAGATDDSLPRSMPVGTYLRKSKWTLHYERNGILCDSGFPWLPGLVAIAAFAALGWSIRIMVDERRTTISAGQVPGSD